jgi:hypothetical protein
MDPRSKPAASAKPAEDHEPRDLEVPVGIAGGRRAGTSRDQRRTMFSCLPGRIDTRLLSRTAPLSGL